MVTSTICRNESLAHHKAKNVEVHKTSWAYVAEHVRIIARGCRSYLSVLWVMLRVDMLKLLGGLCTSGPIIAACSSMSALPDQKVMAGKRKRSDYCTRVPLQSGTTQNDSTQSVADV